MNWVFSFNKLNKIPLYLLSFLIPIFFLPFTQNVSELNPGNKDVIQKIEELNK